MLVAKLAYPAPPAPPHTLTPDSWRPTGHPSFPRTGVFSRHPAASLRAEGKTGKASPRTSSCGFPGSKLESPLFLTLHQWDGSGQARSWRFGTLSGMAVRVTVSECEKKTKKECWCLSHVVRLRKAYLFPLPVLSPQTSDVMLSL